MYQRGQAVQVASQGEWLDGVYLEYDDLCLEHVVACVDNCWHIKRRNFDKNIRPVPAPDSTPIPDDYAAQGEQKPLTPPELASRCRDASPEPRNWSAGYETD